LELLFDSIQSPDDVIAIADFFALPADGWEGDEPPPVVDAFSDIDQTGEPEQISALNWPFHLLAPAYAAKKPTRAKKISTKVITEMLGNASTRIDAAQA